MPFIGGAEIAVKEITERTQTIQFDMITARFGGKLPRKEKIGNITIHRVGIGWPLFDKYLLAFYGHKIAEKLHKENKYDLIWAIMASYGGFAAGFFKKNHPAMPFLLTLQEGDDLKYISRRVGFFRKTFKEIFRRADYIQAISAFLANWAEEQGAKCPIEVVPNGVNSEKFKVINLNLKAEGKVIVTVSRLVEKNGLEYLIEAMRLLPDNVKLAVIGAGELEKKLKSKIVNLKLQDKVKMLGAVDNDSVPNYLAAADVFVRPSLSEGQGISFLEAMAAGVPVIASPVGGIPDFLRDGETGWFCEVKNPRSIAEKIKYVFDEKNKDKVREVANKANKMVEAKYSWEMISSKMKNIFDNL